MNQAVAMRHFESRPAQLEAHEVVNAASVRGKSDLFLPLAGEAGRDVPAPGLFLAGIFMQGTIWPRFPVDNC
jgi:hypothetical protein